MKANIYGIWVITQRVHKTFLIEGVFYVNEKIETNLPIFFILL